MTQAAAHEGRADRDGPRERAIAQGLERLGDADLVAILLGTGGVGCPVTVLAAALLDESGLEGLSRMPPARLAARPCVGPTKALRLAASFELGRRASAVRRFPRPRLASSTEVADFLRPRIAHLDHEEMWLVALDGQNGARAARRVAQGGLHGCAVTARDILRVALGEAASAIVLVHNHPSGDPTPSAEDIAMTRVVADAAEVVGVPLVDHVVIAGARHTSLLDLGMID
jgi:DNA repair protein RadC